MCWQNRILLKMINKWYHTRPELRGESTSSYRTGTGQVLHFWKFRNGSDWQTVKYNAVCKRYLCQVLLLMRYNKFYSLHQHPLNSFSFKILKYSSDTGTSNGWPNGLQKPNFLLKSNIMLGKKMYNVFNLILITRNGSLQTSWKSSFILKV